MGTHPIFESDFDCLTDERCRNSSKRSSMLGLEKKRTYGNESPKRQAEYLVKWNDIKYSDPNPKKWVLDSAYPSDKTSQKALKCFKDENPEKRLLLEQISLNGQTEKSSVLSQKQPEKKRKRLLSSDEDDFALDTIAPKVRKENSEKSINKKSSKKSSEDKKENRPKESTEKSSDVVRKEPIIPKSKEV